MKRYKPIIGLEIHIEPNTKSKMFCSCPQNHFSARPNTQVCPICLGLPGALPYANKEAIYKTIKLGLALNSKINLISKFYRKHYFYPDLPKGYQITQKEEVLCREGELMGKKINHIHLEEDAGKLLHQNGKTLIDFNRSGCALIELVSEPVFSDPSEVLAFTKELQLIIRYLDLSSADMEKGTMRLEANISLSLNGKLPDYKVELKNINSFKFLERALIAEIERQSEVLDKGQKLIQETRGYDEAKKATFSQRSKEESQDYRYFPDADLPPIRLTESEIESIKSSLPELPQDKRIRFKKNYGLPQNFIDILIESRQRADYFEACAKFNNNYKLIADLMVNKNFDQKYPRPAGLARKIYELANMNYESETNTKLAVEAVLTENPEIVAKYQNGQVKVAGFLIGLIQKKLQGRGNPKLINSLLISKLHG